MATESATKFGTLLRRKRLEVGLSQEALAERAGLSARAISDLERGINRAPRRDSVRALAPALGLTAAERAEWEAARRRLAMRDSPPGGVRHSASGLAPSGGERLRRPLTSLVARDAELAEITGMLTASPTDPLGRTRGSVARLLTLTGPAGVGKTRLALEAAARLQDDGMPVHFVDLAAIGDPHAVLPALAAAVGVPDSARSPILDRLRVALSGHASLLVLDNFEHLLAAGVDVVALVAACPPLRVLATSREPLRVYGEREFAVRPLDAPDPERSASPGTSPTASGAARLFAERARAVHRDFTVTDEIATAVARICYRLDGLPLAIELAAARTKLLSPRDLLATLDERFSLLVGGARDWPERHQTLRAAIAWSYDLLLDPERRLFNRLGVFAGGWTLEAAAAVCAGDHVAADDVLGLLAQLVDKSLVVVETSGDRETRYRLLETLREFAQMRLRESGEAEQCRARHAAYFASLAERSEPLIHGPEQAAVGERLQAEDGNLRLALAWALDEASGPAGKEVALRLSEVLAQFRGSRGQARQALAYLEEALATPEVAPPGRRAAALAKAGVLACMLDDFPRARRLAAEALTRSQRLGDDRGLALSHYALGLIELRQGNDEPAAAHATASASAVHTAEDRWMVPLTGHLLGHVALARGDGDQARQHYQESLALAQDLGDTRTVALSFSFLGCAALARGDLAGASQLFLEAQPLLERIGERWHLGLTYAKLAAVALRQDDPGRAASLYRQALSRFRRVDHRRGIVECLAGFGGVAAKAAARIEAHIGLRPSPAERDGRERVLADARSALGEDRFVAAWEAGRAMTIEQAIAYALDEPDDGPA